MSAPPAESTGPRLGQSRNLFHEHPPWTLALVADDPTHVLPGP
ncbi:hypothetical protein AB4212_23400 [Streptomyces sp. 2MCAF27]